MAVEHINDTDTLNQGRVKINAILDQSNASSQKVDGYSNTLTQGIEEAKQIATEAGQDAVKIATEAGRQANVTANEAKGIAQNANTKSDSAVATANQNKQEFDQLRNDFDDLVAESGDSNPEIVQARTDTTGIKQSTLANRLTVDFADRMTNADAIELVSGRSIVKKMMDFNGKTAGNMSTNPHAYYSDYTANTLKKPNATWNEVSQSDYNKLASRDDSGVSTGSTAAGIIPQQLAKLNVVATVKSLSPQLFDGLDDEAAVQFVKDYFVSLSTTIRGRASSPNNKNLKVAIYMPSTDSWSTVIQQEATEYTDFSSQINDPQYITDDGLVYLIYYSDSSNGVTPANIDIDYVGTAISVTLSAQDILASSGFAKIEDVAEKKDLKSHTDDKSNPHNVTKSQVGLANVENYGIATDIEAAAGVAANKNMTPQATAVAIESQVFKGPTKAVQYIAHRGSNVDYPENSLPAFRAVTRHWGIETDIQVTSDGAWICMHDSTVDRTTNGTGTVASKTLSQIKSLRIDTGNNLSTLSDADKQVPTLDDFLTICKTNSRVPIIEIKTGNYSQANYDSIITSLNKFNLAQGVIFISFDYQALVEIKKRLPTVPVQYLVNTISDKLISDAKALGVNSALDVKYNDTSVTANNLIKIHSAGLNAGCWTVPDAQFDAMIALGFDYITTDSKSGNRKWAQLVLENGFTNHGGGTAVPGISFVEELDANTIYLRLNIVDGVNDRGSVITTLPAWAIPLNTRWTDVNIRTAQSGNAIVQKGLDIMGKTITGVNNKPGQVLVSYEWDVRSTWAACDKVYTKY